MRDAGRQECESRELLTDINLRSYSLEEVAAAARHLEDLDVFVGQRSRLHPGPGWELALRLVRRDLELAQAELASRAASRLDSRA